ncbi:DUF982 domain-containing protein [Mesorhizobium sp. ZC-5]|uniref:DUF982 domain-containing protein n=1 Tax=Mesorhizobium sp. ZC-5 TaxID=2986066 RepID=UPI00399313D0
MTACRFDQPVSVILGLGFPHTVETVLDAYHVLLEWNGIPDLDYHAAIDLCVKALRGEATASETQEAFKRFADNRGILSEEAIERAAEKFAREWVGMQ